MSNEKKEKNLIVDGDIVSVHYHGTLNDGSTFDSSYDRGDPINFTVGSGMMIEGFENNIRGMSLGEKKKFTIPSDQAYGPHDEEAVQNIPREQFPQDMEIEPGLVVTGGRPNGQSVNATIVSENENTVTLDFNHPMAGKDLTFEVEIVHLETKSNEEATTPGVESSD